MGESEEITIRLVDDIGAIPAEDWDACANPGGETPHNPFIRHAFLHALEASGSATARTGWAPCHLILERPGAPIAGAVPLYLKSHSYGEYVFDHAWADAFYRAGGEYYPKLQASVPFTPATGRRLLARPGPDIAATERHLIAGCLAAADKLGVSSLHFTFLPEDQWHRLGEAGLLLRTDQQFHWENNGYSTFDDFLNDLASRKRKNLRKERAAALESGVEIEWVTGSDLTEDHWDAFFTFYMDTGARKWGTPYLTREFFSRIGETMPEDTLLVMCKRAGRYIAGALNFIGGDTLYGRNWGCIEHHPFLHFEACYYQAIDFAIARGLKRVEAGAQGQHKLARGYLPARTMSAHYIVNPSLRNAIAHYLESERDYVDQDIELLTRHSPFRKQGQD